MKKWVKQLFFFSLVILIAFLAVYYLAFNIGVISLGNQQPAKPYENQEVGNNTENIAVNGSSLQDNGSNSGSILIEGEGDGDKSWEEEPSSFINTVIPEPLPNRTLLIASWQIYPFDDQKSYDNSVMDAYASIIGNYDIFFLQGITSSNAFSRLCGMLPKYNCISSTLSGEPESGYGVIYKKGNLSIASISDYNPDSLSRWKHPPLEVLFEIEDYYFRLYSIEADQSNVEEELSNLEGAVEDNGNMIIIGDLNADCGYYNPSSGKFGDWYWIIGDNSDTTVSSSDCAYDRIILNSELYGEFAPYELGTGVYRGGITSELSDHYIVWIEIRPEEQS
ncbi:MAG: endonuclease/exonuclease/phosphatase family protein [archaeon]